MKKFLEFWVFSIRVQKKAKWALIWLLGFKIGIYPRLSWLPFRLWRQVTKVGYHFYFNFGKFDLYVPIFPHTFLIVFFLCKAVFL